MRGITVAKVKQKIEDEERDKRIQEELLRNPPPPEPEPIIEKPVKETKKSTSESPKKDVKFIKDKFNESLQKQ